MNAPTTAADWQTLTFIARYPFLLTPTGQQHDAPLAVRLAAAVECAEALDLCARKPGPNNT